MFCNKRKTNFRAELKKNGNMTPNHHGDLCGLFDLVDNLKGHGVIRGRSDLLYDPKFTVTFVVGLT